MAKLEKRTLALSFKLDCDRFLRFRLASDDERNTMGIFSQIHNRPGIKVIEAVRRSWELDKYQDIIDIFGDGEVEFILEDTVDNILERKPFKKIQNLFEILQRKKPPQAVIEAEFVTPVNIFPGLQKAYEEFGLDEIKIQPDVLFIQPGRANTPLIGNPTTTPEYEIHIGDVTILTEPALWNLAEAAYYALTLAAAIEKEGLQGRYGVSAEGIAWPANYDRAVFRKLVHQHSLAVALDEILIRVPYKNYERYLKQFFENRLLHILQTDIADAIWHVRPKCQFCEYVRFCIDKASECDHLSRLAWLDQKEAELLRGKNIHTTTELAEAAAKKNHKWMSVIESSHQLQKKGRDLAVRARSLAEGVPLLVDEEGRNEIIPAWTDQSIFITIHFDSCSELSFSLGATRLYFLHGSNHTPFIDEKIFIIDRIGAMNPETEREKFEAFIATVSGWIKEVQIRYPDSYDGKGLSSHIFFWDMLVVNQFKRMLNRYTQDSRNNELVKMMTQCFSMETSLQDREVYKTSSYTIVKELLRVLVGLPVAHHYSLFDVANTFSSITQEDGTPYIFNLPFGFKAPLNDQIPFERACELWQDRISIRHFNNFYHAEPSKWRRYSRDGLYSGIKQATKIHLQALQHIVQRLRDYSEGRLMMKKQSI